MEPPQGAVQRGELEQDGGTKLCLQDGAAHGCTDSMSLDAALFSTHQAAFYMQLKGTALKNCSLIVHFSTDGFVLLH